MFSNMLIFIKSNMVLSICTSMILIALIVVLVLYRESKIVINIIGNAIVEAEQKLNSEPGQKKLEWATERVKEQLPKYISMFVTKAMIVSLIEFLLNFIGKAFKVNKVVDIKGNEEVNVGDK